MTCAFFFYFSQPKSLTTLLCAEYKFLKESYWNHHMQSQEG